MKNTRRSEYSRKRVLITGGAGSLGRRLSLRLAGMGHRVRAFDLPSCDFSSFTGVEGVEVLKGDIGDADAVPRAVAGVDVVVHLAALLPPVSERDRRVTMSVNVGGTEKVVEALEQGGRNAHLILASSVCVYGDTSGDAEPIAVTYPPSAKDVYGESKIEAERVVLGTTLPHTILRISGIAVPEFMEPPAVWPFTRDQRIEFVCRRDVVEALSVCVQVAEAKGKIFNIAGGPTWRMRGDAYVARFNEVMGMPLEEAVYDDRPGAFDWYDTDESQVALRYQQTSFDRYLGLLESAIEEALG